MKKLLGTLAIIGLAGLIFSGTSWAADYEKRLIKQQLRIWRSFNNGHLNRHEVRRLMHEQHKIRRHMRSFASDGHLSHKEKQRIKRWLHKSRRHIRHFSHNGNQREWNWWPYQRYRRSADRKRWHIW